MPASRISTRHRMRELNAALARFFQVLSPAWSSRVTVMTFSEFGRTSWSNDGAGTDHGTAAPHFVLGANVRGGRYGQRPSLAGLRRWDRMPFHVDFRDYYGSVIDGWLGGGRVRRARWATHRRPRDCSPAAPGVSPPPTGGPPSPADERGPGGRRTGSARLVRAARPARVCDSRVGSVGTAADQSRRDRRRQSPVAAGSRRRACCGRRERHLGQSDRAGVLQRVPVGRRGHRYVEPEHRARSGGPEHGGRRCRPRRPDRCLQRCWHHRLHRRRDGLRPRRFGVGVPPAGTESVARHSIGNRRAGRSRSAAVSVSTCGSPDAVAYRSPAWMQWCSMSLRCVRAFPDSCPVWPTGMAMPDVSNLNYEPA